MADGPESPCHGPIENDGRPGAGHHRRRIPGGERHQGAPPTAVPSEAETSDHTTSTPLSGEGLGLRDVQQDEVHAEPRPPGQHAEQQPHPRTREAVVHDERLRTSDPAEQQHVVHGVEKRSPGPVGQAVPYPGPAPPVLPQPGRVHYRSAGDTLASSVLLPAPGTPPTTMRASAG